jgi:hypothetical protein
MALPSSIVNPRMIRHGLRPRHVADTLAIIACSATGFQVVKPLAQCKIDKFRGSIPSLALQLTIHLSLSLAHFVTSIHIKFRSGLVANLWLGWIAQPTHNSFAWRTLCFVSMPKHFGENCLCQNPCQVKKNELFPFYRSGNSPCRPITHEPAAGAMDFESVCRSPKFRVLELLPDICSTSTLVVGPYFYGLLLAQK